MSADNKNNKVPIALAVGSFFCMLILALFTNPLSNVVYAILFFIAFTSFLVGGGYLIILRHREILSQKNKSRVLIISVFITLMLMLRSAGALGWLDAVVLLLLTIGLLFYAAKRA